MSELDDMNRLRVQAEKRVTLLEGDLKNMTACWHAACEDIGKRDERIAELEAQDDRRVASMAELCRVRDRLASRLGAVEAELDEASPMRTCARCGTQDRSHRMAIEEGDEWECFPCWERCNAQEREAAKMLDGAGPGQLAPVVEEHDPFKAQYEGHDISCEYRKTGKEHDCSCAVEGQRS